MNKIFQIPYAAWEDFNTCSTEVQHLELSEALQETCMKMTDGRVQSAHFQASHEVLQRGNCGRNANLVEQLLGACFFSEATLPTWEHVA